MDNHISLNLGNVILIGAVSLLTGAVVGVAVHVLSAHNVPVLSPTARGVVDMSGKIGKAA